MAPNRFEAWMHPMLAATLFPEHPVRPTVQAAVLVQHEAVLVALAKGQPDVGELQHHLLQAERAERAAATCIGPVREQPMQQSIQR